MKHSTTLRRLYPFVKGRFLIYNTHMNIKTRKITIWVTIALVAVGGLLTYLQQRGSAENNNPNGSDAGFEFDETANSESVLSGSDDSNLDTETIDPSIPSEGPEFEAAKQRDEQRLKDIQEIADALKDFVNDAGNYPSEVAELVPDYLAQLPTNPTPGGFEYSYTPIGSEPATYYSLYYHLEVGAGDVSAGDHEATPDGIATL